MTQAFRFLVVGLLLAPALLPRPGVGQSAPAIPAEVDGPGGQGADPQTLIVDVDRVAVPFTVTDLDGRIVTDLTAADVRVYEDGVRQEIESFDAQTELPLTIVLAMDTSGSVRNHLEFEQDAAIEFFFTVIERRRDQGMLVTFDSSVQVLQDFTDSPEALSDAVRGIRVGGSSAMYDAIYLAISQKIVEQPAEARRVIVIISDGDDNASLKTFEDALEIAQRNDVVIYTLSTNSAADFGADRQIRGDRLLDQLASETGGRAFYPLDMVELVRNLENITEELRSQYYITYVSGNPARDGSRRALEVLTSDRSLVVSARKFYFAPRD
jgi:VWFA-related protein